MTSPIDENDKAWRKYVVGEIIKLNAAHKEIQEILRKNTEVTESIYAIMQATKVFWNFMTRVGNCTTWIAKKGTILAVFIVSMAGAINVLLSHDMLNILRSFFRK